VGFRTTAAIETGSRCWRSRADYEPWASATNPFAAGSPWQNSFAERLIGTIRRECVDHIIVLGEVHLRRIIGHWIRMRLVSRSAQKIGVSHALVCTENLACIDPATESRNVTRK